MLTCRGDIGPRPVSEAAGRVRKGRGEVAPRLLTVGAREPGGRRRRSLPVPEAHPAGRLASLAANRLGHAARRWQTRQGLLRLDGCHICCLQILNLAESHKKKESISDGASQLMRGSGLGKKVASRAGTEGAGLARVVGRTRSRHPCETQLTAHRCHQTRHGSGSSAQSMHTPLYLHILLLHRG